jgi:TolA-binding protein
MRLEVIWVSILFISHHALAQKNSHTEAFKAFSKMNEEATASKTETKSVPDKIKKSTKLDEGGLRQQLPSAEKLETQITSLESLLKLEKGHAKLSKFRANLAVLYFQRAQVKRLESKDTTPEEKKDLDNVISTTTKNITDKKADKNYLDMSYYLRSLAYVEIDKRDKAAADLVKMISKFPDSKFAPGASLFVAEYEFEKEKYKEALKYYKLKLSSLPKDQQILARYKMAWCRVNLMDFDGARNDFLNIVNNDSQSEFADDSIKDLAFLVVMNATEKEIVEYGDQWFQKNIEAHKTYLNTALQNINHSKTITKTDLLLNKILTLEKDPNKRLQTWLYEVRNRRRNYASLRHAEIIERMFEDIGVSFNSQKLPAEFGPEIEAELNSIIRSFVDTFNGGTKNIEKLTKDDMSRHLFKFFNYHYRTFPESKVKNALFELWLGFCEELNDSSCVQKLSKLMMNKDFSDDSKYKAAVSNLVAVEQLYQKDKEKNEAEYISSLKNFLDKYPTKPEWTEAAAKYAAFQMQNDKHNEAIPYLEKVYASKKDGESYKRMVTVYYLSGQYDKVLNSKAPATVAKDKEVLDLQRESSLKLAASSRNEKTEDYEKHIDQYMALSTDKKKSALVAADFLSKCASEKQYSKALAKIQNWDADIVKSHEVQVQIVAMMKALLAQADSTGTSFCSHIKDSAAYEYDCSLLKHIGGEGFSFSKISHLPPEKKDYLLSVYTLLTPQAVVQEFKAAKPKLSEGEKKVVFLAYQIQQGKKRPDLNDFESKYFESYLPKYEKAAPITAIEKRMQAIHFPEMKMAGPKTQKSMIATLQSVQKTRAEVVTSLKNNLPLTQMRIVETAKKLEQKAALMIENSPVPKQLKKEQIAEYKAGLKQAAQEYHDQEAEYEKLKGNIAVALKKGQAQYEALKVLPWSAKAWTWPVGEASQKAKVMLANKKYLQAMFFIDLQKGANNLSDDDYAYLRAAVLLLAQRNDFMKDYVYRELEQNDRKEVIKKWESLTNS